MKPQTRHFIFLLFVSAFLATTVAVILYGSGYAIMPGFSGLKKTGMLYVKAEPKNSHLLVNGVTRSRKLPDRIVHLQPATYTVELQKEGYHAWKKNLQVYPGETTFVTDVTLWRDTTPVQLMELSAPYDIIAHSGSELIGYTTVQGVAELVSINTATQQLTSLYRAPHMDGAFQHPLASLSATYVLLPASPSSHGESVIVSTQSSEVLSIGDATSTFTHFVWDNKADWLLFMQDNNGTVWQYTVLDQSLRPITHGELLAVADASVMVMRRADDTSGRIIAYNTTTGRETVIEELLPGQPLNITATFNTSALLNSNNNDALRVSGVEKRFEKLSANRVSLLAESSHSSVYAYATQNEVWFHSPIQGHSLVWRSSDSIRKIRFLPGEKYLMVSTDKEITILEVDVRDSVNKISLSVGNVTSFDIDEKTSTLFYTQRSAEDNTYRLYTLKLQ